MRMKKNITAMGDFNCNMPPVSFYNANTQALLNITDVYNLKQLITELLLNCSFFFSAFILSSLSSTPFLVWPRLSSRAAVCLTIRTTNKRHSKKKNKT